MFHSSPADGSRARDYLSERHSAPVLLFKNMFWLNLLVVIYVQIWRFIYILIIQCPKQQDIWTSSCVYVQVKKTTNVLLDSGLST